MIERLSWALVCLFVFTIPWEKSVWIPGIGTGTRLLGVFALGFGLLAAAQRRKVRLPNLVLLLAALFVGWESLSWFWSIDPMATAGRAWTLLQLYGMLCLVWDLCRSEDRQRQLLHAYVSGAVVASAYTVLRFILNQQTYWRRYAAAGFDPNDLGLTIALGVPLALYLSFEARGVAPWLYRLAIAVIEVAIILTASRTALIAVILAFGFAAWTWREAGLTQRVSAIVLLAILGVGAVCVAPRGTRERLATLPNELTGGTLHNRTRIWKAGLKALKSRPLRGVGAGAYPEAVKPWLGVPPIPGHEYVAHNTFLSVLVESGIIGFGIFGLLLSCCAFFIWMMPQPERALWAITVSVWTIGVSTLTWENRKPTWLVIALITTVWARAYWPTSAREALPPMRRAFRRSGS